MKAVLNTAREQGWSENQLHYEFFAAQVTPSESDASVEVKLANSGRIITVPRDKAVTTWRLPQVMRDPDQAGAMGPHASSGSAPDGAAAHAAWPRRQYHGPPRSKLAR